MACPRPASRRRPPARPAAAKSRARFRRLRAAHSMPTRRCRPRRNHPRPQRRGPSPRGRGSRGPLLRVRTRHGGTRRRARTGHRRRWPVRRGSAALPPRPVAGRAPQFVQWRPAGQRTGVHALVSSGPTSHGLSGCNVSTLNDVTDHRRRVVGLVLAAARIRPGVCAPRPKEARIIRDSGMTGGRTRAVAWSPDGNGSSHRTALPRVRNRARSSPAGSCGSDPSRAARHTQFVHKEPRVGLSARL